jgi:hypothetical protein
MFREGLTDPTTPADQTDGGVAGERGKGQSS